MWSLHFQGKRIHQLELEQKSLDLTGQLYRITSTTTQWFNIALCGRLLSTLDIVNKYIL